MDDPTRPPGDDRPMPRLPAVDPAASAPAGGDVSPEVFASFLTDGDEELARWVLGLAMRGRSRAATYDTFLREAMAIVGERWTTGRWTISEEHLASRTLARVLSSLAPPPPAADRVAPVAALAGVAGEEHSTGLMVLDHVLREVGWATVDLGPNVPAEDLVRFCAKWEVRLVALTATLGERLPTLQDTVAALRASPVPPVVMVGGRIVEVSDRAAAWADWAGTSLEEAARYASGVLERVRSESAGS